MTKRYSVLQKKLHELESQLNTIFSFSEDSDHDHNEIITKLSNDFIHRTAFFKSLLTAEVASHPSKPHHLQHMSRRLDQLDAFFRDWAVFGNSLFHRHIDGDSTCSCTESCLNDDGEVSDEIVLDDHGVEGFEDQDQDDDDDDDGLAMVEHYNNYKESFGDGDHEETASFGDVRYFSDCFADDQEEKSGDHNYNHGVDNNNNNTVVVRPGELKGCFFGALASGMALGMALMGFVTMLFSGCFEDREPKYVNFLTPT